MFIITGVYLRVMNTETDEIRERMTDEELASAFPNTRKEMLTTMVTKGTSDIELELFDGSAIQNVVKSVEGSMAMNGEMIKWVYISNMRLYIQFTNGKEYNFPLAGGHLLD